MSLDDWNGDLVVQAILCFLIVYLVEQRRSDDIASLVLIFGILAILVGLSVWAPDLIRIFRDWWLG